MTSSTDFTGCFDVERKPLHTYLDPLDAIWLTVAARVGFRVERSAEVYASTDGKGAMTIGTPSTLDPDDCLAQMILHELCHSLIEGAESLGVPDFGLDNESERHVVREHACLRLQAWLTDKHGLRQALAPTTDFRSYYDDLPEDPFADQGDPATGAAKLGSGSVGGGAMGATPPGRVGGDGENPRGCQPVRSRRPQRTKSAYMVEIEAIIR